jgi:hypothetical protein
MAGGIARCAVRSETEKTSFFKLDNSSPTPRSLRGDHVPTFSGWRGCRVTDRDIENLQDGKSAP